VDFSAAATLRSSYGILKEQGIRLVFVAVGEDASTTRALDIGIRYTTHADSQQAAMKQACDTGQYTLRQIADYFGVRTVR
jgi:hypothetical protein